MKYFSKILQYSIQKVMGIRNIPLLILICLLATAHTQSCLDPSETHGKCSACESTKFLLSGKCFDRLKGCLEHRIKQDNVIEIEIICEICQSGYVRNGVRCERKAVAELRVGATAEIVARLNTPAPVTGDVAGVLVKESIKGAEEGVKAVPKEEKVRVKVIPKFPEIQFANLIKEPTQSTKYEDLPTDLDKKISSLYPSLSGQHPLKLPISSPSPTPTPSPSSKYFLLYEEGSLLLIQSSDNSKNINNLRSAAQGLEYTVSKIGGSRALGSQVNFLKGRNNGWDVFGAGLAVNLEIKGKQSGNRAFINVDLATGQLRSLDSQKEPSELPKQLPQKKLQLQKHLSTAYSQFLENVTVLNIPESIHSIKAQQHEKQPLIIFKIIYTVQDEIEKEYSLIRYKIDRNQTEVLGYFIEGANVLGYFNKTNQTVGNGGGSGENGTAAGNVTVKAEGAGQVNEEKKVKEAEKPAANASNIGQPEKKLQPKVQQPKPIIKQAEPPAPTPVPAPKPQPERPQPVQTPKPEQKPVQQKQTQDNKISSAVKEEKKIEAVSPVKIAEPVPISAPASAPVPAAVPVSSSAPAAPVSAVPSALPSAPAPVSIPPAAAAVVPSTLSSAPAPVAITPAVAPAVPVPVPVPAPTPAAVPVAPKPQLIQPPKPKLNLTEFIKSSTDILTILKQKPQFTKRTQKGSRLISFQTQPSQSKPQITYKLKLLTPTGLTLLKLLQTLSPSPSSTPSTYTEQYLLQSPQNCLLTPQSDPVPAKLDVILKKSYPILMGYGRYVNQYRLEENYEKYVFVYGNQQNRRIFYEVTKPRDSSKYSISRSGIYENGYYFEKKDLEALNIKYTDLEQQKYDKQTLKLPKQFLTELQTYRPYIYNTSLQSLLTNSTHIKLYLSNKLITFQYSVKLDETVGKGGLAVVDRKMGFDVWPVGMGATGIGKRVTGGADVGVCQKIQEAVLRKFKSYFSNGTSQFYIRKSPSIPDSYQIAFKTLFGHFTLTSTLTPETVTLGLLKKTLQLDESKPSTNCLANQFLDVNDKKCYPKVVSCYRQIGNVCLACDVGFVVGTGMRECRKACAC